jgi:hypothetical protein
VFTDIPVLDNDEAIDLLRNLTGMSTFIWEPGSFLPEYVSDDDIKEIWPDFYDILTGKLDDSSDEAKLLFLSFVYTMINTKTENANERINFAETALMQWVESKDSELLSFGDVGIKLDEEKDSDSVDLTLNYESVNLQSIAKATKSLFDTMYPDSKEAVSSSYATIGGAQDFVDWSYALSNALGGFTAIVDRDQMLYLKTYLDLRRQYSPDSEIMQMFLSTQLLSTDFGLELSADFGLNGDEEIEKWNRFAECIYQVEKSLQ